MTVSCMCFFLFHCHRLGWGSLTFYINYYCKRIDSILMSLHSWQRHQNGHPKAQLQTSFSYSEIFHGSLRLSEVQNSWRDLPHAPKDGAVWLTTLTQSSRHLLVFLSSSYRPLFGMPFSHTFIPTAGSVTTSQSTVYPSRPILNKSFPKSLSYSLVSSLLGFHSPLLISLMVALNTLLYVFFLHSTIHFLRALIPPICLNKAPVQSLLHSTWICVCLYTPSHLLVLLLFRPALPLLHCLTLFFRCTFTLSLPRPSTAPTTNTSFNLPAITFTCI